MKKFLLLLSIFCISASCANAAIDSGQLKTEQYFLNAGYSSMMAELVKFTNRDPYQDTKDIYPKDTFVTKLKYLWKRVDPAAYPELNTYWHDTTFYPNIKDF